MTGLPCKWQIHRRAAATATAVPPPTTRSHSSPATIRKDLSGMCLPLHAMADTCIGRCMCFRPSHVERAWPVAAIGSCFVPAPPKGGLSSSLFSFMRMFMRLQAFVAILALAGLWAAPCRATPAAAVAVAVDVASSLASRNYLPQWSVDDHLTSLIPDEPTHLRCVVAGRPLPVAASRRSQASSCHSVRMPQGKASPGLQGHDCLLPDGSCVPRSGKRLLADHARRHKQLGHHRDRRGGGAVFVCAWALYADYLFQNTAPMTCICLPDLSHAAGAGRNGGMQDAG